jgi:hypothetical protein
MAMIVPLRVWRQAGPDQPGRLVDYVANNVHPDMSFLEMLDMPQIPDGVFVSRQQIA